MLSDRFRAAFDYAFELHAEQTKRGTTAPYIAHLMAVAAVVLDHGGDEDEAVAALLHDAVEDQGGAETRREIRRRFGERVAAIVEGCTDCEISPKPPWRERKEAYLARLPEENPSVRLVSVADKLVNARGILENYRVLGDELWKRFHGGREGTLWYYRSLVAIFRETGPEPLADELRRTVAELERTVGHRRHAARRPPSAVGRREGT